MKAQRRAAFTGLERPHDPADQGMDHSPVEQLRRCLRMADAPHIIPVLKAANDDVSSIPRNDDIASVNGLDGVGHDQVVLADAKLVLIGWRGEDEWVTAVMQGSRNRHLTTHMRSIDVLAHERGERELRCHGAHGVALGKSCAASLTLGGNEDSGSDQVLHGITRRRGRGPTDRVADLRVGWR